MIQRAASQVEILHLCEVCDGVDVGERFAQTQVELLNLTGGMGGDLWFDLGETAQLSSASDFVGPIERVEHIIKLTPEIGSLD